MFDFLAGWGHRREHGNPSTYLMATNVSIVSRERCNTQFPYRGQIGKHSFCAGTKTGGHDTCQVCSFIICFIREFNLFHSNFYVENEKKWRVTVVEAFCVITFLLESFPRVTWYYIANSHSLLLLPMQYHRVKHITTLWKSSYDWSNNQCLKNINSKEPV